MRNTSRLILLIALLGATGPALPAAPEPPARGDDATAAILPEVRLRKLHLVRPDLILYPMAYEVLC